MLEREFEILLRMAPEEFLPKDWTLKAQQLNLTSGRLDMLFVDTHSFTHVVELKKGSAPRSSVDQVLEYAKEIRLNFPHKKFIPWVIAHEISSVTRNHANDNKVKTLAIPTAMCFEVMKKRNITEKDLAGRRLTKKTLHGGGSGIKPEKQIPNNEVFKEISEDVAELLRGLNKIEHIDMTSGSMQTLIHYKGFKLGGYNRKHRGRHGYITEGVVLSEEISDKLKALNFVRMTKTQQGSSHMHIWWEIRESDMKSFSEAIKLCITTVESFLD